MIIDCHVHISANTPGHGLMSPRLLNSVPFLFLRWRFGLNGDDAQAEGELEKRLVQTIAQTPIDAAVVLAFDAVYDEHGRLDRQNTHLYVTNDYVMELSRRHRQVLFGASVHPYRKDAIEEIERCVKSGAVLMKWLPVVQGIDPADPKCIPFYEALAHHKLPLLSHTGGEQSLPAINGAVEDPTLLTPALDRGVTVIAAHCGTRSTPWGRDYVPQFMRMAQEYEHFYGDTSALNLPTRAYAYPLLLGNNAVREKLIHGSDWPIVPLPAGSQLGYEHVVPLMLERNWMKRDVLIKRRLGFDEAYFRRGAEILRASHALTGSGT